MADKDCLLTEVEDDEVVRCVMYAICCITVSLYLQSRDELLILRCYRLLGHHQDCFLCFSFTRFDHNTPFSTLSPTALNTLASLHRTSHITASNLSAAATYLLPAAQRGENLNFFRRFLIFWIFFVDLNFAVLPYVTSLCSHTLCSYKTSLRMNLRKCTNSYRTGRKFSAYANCLRTWFSKLSKLYSEKKKCLTNLESLFKNKQSTGSQH